jgi:hypothetical protein
MSHEDMMNEFRQLDDRQRNEFFAMLVLWTHLQLTGGRIYRANDVLSLEMLQIDSRWMRKRGWLVSTPKTLT